MEDFPDELRTPPVSLISLIGRPDLHQTISAFVHAEQPPINVLALPGFAEAAGVLSRQSPDPLSQEPQRSHVAGVLKREWLPKHRTRVPAVVAAMFGVEEVTGDPTQWMQVCNDLENLKAVIRGRNTKLVVILVQTNVRDEVSEDLLIALRKRAEIDSKYLVTYTQNNASELRQSLKRLAGLFAELCNTYYREEGRRIRSRIEKRNFSELHVRYCFKVAIYAEFRRDWVEALRFNEDAYTALREMVGTSTRLPPVQRLVEIKSVAEQLHFKISTLLLHGGKVVEAIAWFHKHITTYERLVGEPEVAFLHWEWLSRQFLVFAELLETSSAAIPSTLPPRFGSSDNPLTEWEFQPPYYYQLSAKYLREKKERLAESLRLRDCSELADRVNTNLESVVPSTYVGQFVRLVEEGDSVTVLPLSDAEYTSYAIAEAQRFQESYEIIALLRKSFESFSGLRASRTASYCRSQMAKEYFVVEDYSNAKQLFDSVAELYRQEGWVTLLWETLGYLRRCSQKLGLLKELVEYSLEMAAMPVPLNSKLVPSDGTTHYGPAGPATLLQRKKIQDEVFTLLKGQELTHQNDEVFKCNQPENQPLRLEVDLISPLRMVLLASVAFHDQSIKPGTSTQITLSLLSQLPHPVEVEQLEIQFNQSACNFVIVNDPENSSAEDQGIRAEMAPSLTLTSSKWLRLTYELKSGQSGRLECLSVTAKIGPHFIVCCQAESPASMEDVPLWKFEDRVETFPTKDPGLSFSSQKFLQVEEPEPLVDLILSASGPALVGENFIVPVSVTSKGHMVSFGELKINLVDARGGGLLMSPRDHESFSNDSHHVELLSISGVHQNEETDSNNINKIQQSFGVISIPDLNPGESWSCKLETKWHRPKSVMLYVSLGYVPKTDEGGNQRVHVHRSLQVEGKVPLIITHRFLMPFRREPLLLSNVKSAPDFDQGVFLALNEPSVLIVKTRNCTEITLQLISMTIESDSTEGSEPGCKIQQNSDFSDAWLLAPGEEFKQVFAVTPSVDFPTLAVGTVCVKWTRESKFSQDIKNSFFITRHKLPDVNVEKPPLIVSIECPPNSVLGTPFSLYVKIRNMTSLLQEIKYSLGDSQSFLFCGPHNDSVSVLPKTEHIISYKLVPLASGSQLLPKVNITASRYLASMQPSAAASSIFVFPSVPTLSVEGREADSNSLSG